MSERSSKHFAALRAGRCPQRVNMPVPPSVFLSEAVPV